jgi:hypothetical protein
MPRRLIPVFFTVACAAFAQFGGIVLPGGGMRLPGTTYPGGQYPGNGNGTCPGGQYPTNGTCPGGQNPNNGMPGMMQVLTGNLRQISPYDLAMETDDSRIIRMQIARNARLYSTFGNARYSDFDPGDYINVQAAQDINGNFTAQTVTMTRKGTPRERTAASQPLNVSMHDNSNRNSQGGNSQDDSDSNRPVLHRAGDSGDSSSNSGSQDNDPDRPVMRRAGSSDSDSASSGSSGSSRPRAVSQGDDGAPPAQIAPIDDPGPPAMRRGATPRDQNASETVPDSPPPSRPTVRAQESNGVTQVPPPPPPPQTVEEARNMAPDRLPQPSGQYATDDPVIDQAREAAFAFTETLPNYIVKQYTTRYQSNSARRGGTQWQELDIVTADVVAENGKETYKNVLVNGKASRNVEDTGSWSEGEFASTLQAILSPASDALFVNKRATTIVNRPAWRYDYTIEQPRSSWQVEAGGSRFRPAYGGAIWIDKETNRVLRIEMSARKVPAEFPLDQVESTVDYDFVLIGDKKFLLPVHSEALSCERGTSECARNVIDFRNYKKYGSDSSVTFDDTAK